MPQSPNPSDKQSVIIPDSPPTPAQHGPDDSVPPISPETPTPRHRATKPSTAMPAALKRLLPHSTAGLKEALAAPENGGRPRRGAMNLGGM